MSGTLVIAARELRANTRIFVISAAFAVWPFLAALLPTSRGNREEVIVVMGGFIAVAVGCGLAVALGISTIGRELSERRMSFYFGKPVSAAAIWFGKAGAAILTAVSCFAFIAVPAYLASPQTWRTRWLGDVQPLILAALVIAGLFFISHYVSTILRSRSLLLGVDIICLLLLVTGLYLILRPVAVGGAGDLAMLILISMGVLAAALLVVAPVWQLSRGRTDVRRGHAALSRLMWTVLGVALLIVAGYVAWLVSVDPAELQDVRFVAQPARGNAIFVSGVGEGRGEYASNFLIDGRTGRSRRLWGMPRWWGGTFSEDGEVFSWLQPVGVLKVTGFELYTTRVAGGKSVASGITMSLTGKTTLSKDGSQVAVIDGSLVSLFDVASHRLLAAGAGLDRQSNHYVLFAGPGVLRIVELPRSTRDATIVRVFELDMRRRTMSKTGEQVLPGGRDVSLSLSGDGTRMFVRGVNTIIDGRTAGLVARVNGDGSPAASGILHDGTVATITPKVPRLQVYSRDGLPLRVIALPGVDRAVLSGEIDGGKLIVVGSSGLPGSPAGERRMFLIDVRRGVIERVVKGLLGPLPDWSEGRLIRYAADQRLVLLDKRETLLAFDPRTGVVGKLKM